MPGTFMRYFYMGAALRWLMRNTPWPSIPVYEEMRKAFDDAFSDTVRGTRVTDILAFGEDKLFQYDAGGEVALTQHIYAALLRIVNAASSIAFQSADSDAYDGKPRLHPRAHVVTSLQRDGIRFATRDKGERDSYVTFRVSGNKRVRAGQISQLFCHHRVEGKKQIVEPFAVVQVYKDLSATDVLQDPYRKFPGLNTQLYYDEFDDETLVVPFKDVTAHFAAFTYVPAEIGVRCTVARSLDRVSRSSGVHAKYADRRHLRSNCGRGCVVSKDT